ncbi:MAG: HDOD domain-containing protein [Burkholderiales bacterium]|nr:HDOD domain-containing protein [Burkholderiales bacterium]
MPAAAPAHAYSPAPPAALGRYRVERELGRGAQGCVYLAHDSQLQRPVAIKTLAPGQDAARRASLLAEARTTAQLTHPNIVTLYDAFEDHGLLCLVLEYVEGQTLEHLLRAQGRLDPARAAAVIVQVLDALAYAHERAVVHRDIKPANILIDAAGNARLMDFGIAVTAGDADAVAPAGTARYMAPESFDSGTIARSTDVFSAGMTLYELLTGRAAAQGRNVFEVLHKIANEPFPPPSSANGDVGEALDQIVMRAIAKEPAARYADANEMRRALQHYLHPDATEAATGEGGGAIDFLLNRMRHKSSFPALSGTISAINRVTSGREQSVQALSDVLLKDFALTNKLLRLVNSSGYGQFGGTVSTISRAVLILGFDAVRDLAITLVLFEHLQNKGQAAKLRDDVIHSLLLGIMARRLARGTAMRDTEESFICGVFHKLGRLLASFYLYDESVEIARRMQQANVTEAEASKAVLGVTYDEIGIAVARSWNLPPTIVASMQPAPDERANKPTAPAERLHLTACMADALAQAACAGSPAERDRQLARIAGHYRNAVDLDERQLGSIAAEAVNELLDDAASLLGDSTKSKLCQGLRQTAGETPPPQAAADTLDRAIEHANRIASHPGESGRDAEPAQILAAGIQDITNSLVENFNLSDLLRIILETMYRAMGFARVVLFMRDSRLPSMTARFGYGAEMDRLVSRLCVPVGRSEDVFSVVLAKNVDLLISDIDAANIRSRIPEWLRKHGLGHTFVLLPLVIETKALGLFYGDKANAGELTIDAREMNLLKTLRNQAVLALRQRR